MLQHVLVELPSGIDKSSHIRLIGCSLEKHEIVLEIEKKTYLFTVDKVFGTMIINYKEKTYTTRFCGQEAP